MASRGSASADTSWRSDDLLDQLEELVALEPTFF
jgi:hypothetical protein